MREFYLFRDSIRLPRGRFFVTVTEQADFEKIEEQVPRCVQTRLDEFLAGPGRKRGVKIYYLKPLCVEVGDQLVLTTRDDLLDAIRKVQDEVFAAYARLAWTHRSRQACEAIVDCGLAIPRRIAGYVVQRRKRALDAYHARLEFNRRKLALRAAKTHCALRTDRCTFDDMLELTTPPDRRAAAEQYCLEKELTQAQRWQMVQLATGGLPWFVTLSLTASYIASLALIAATPPIAVCDPAFVAEMPDRPGVLWKIGHFDEVDGVVHVEI
ncbi:MAG: hypothetical protein KDA61_18880 [Planctomycetales bacterium]|nr:hypothetical protein [Planctomycetales bacterium]